MQEAIDSVSPFSVSVCVLFVVVCVCICVRCGSKVEALTESRETEESKWEGRQRLFRLQDTRHYRETT